MFWPSRDEAHRRSPRGRSTYVDVAVGNLDECEVAIGERDPQRGRQRAAATRASTLAVVKQGPAGVLGVARRRVRGRAAGARSTSSTASAPATPSAARCATACSRAGTLERMLRFANAAGAIVAGRLACADAMPTTAEVEKRSLEEARA